MADIGRIIFVTGANRGIGLAFVKQLVGRGDTVIAGYRAPRRSKTLLRLAQKNDCLHTVQVDVTDHDESKKARDYIADQFGRLDTLINNAGVSIKYETPIHRIRPGDLMENFRVNVIGPFLAAKTMRPLLSRGNNSKIINISSQMGSIEQASDDAIAYRISKAAVNMLTRIQSRSYLEEGIITAALHPGWVRTDMGGPAAPLSPMQSVSNMLKVIDRLSEKDNGAFIGHDGRRCPY